MKKTAGNALVVCLCLTLVSILFPSCSGKENPEQPSSDFNISGIVLPQTIEVEVGQPVELVVKGGHGPVATDVVVLEGASRWEIKSLTIKTASFSFVLPDKLSSGDYTLHIKRGETAKKVGKTRIVVRSGGSVNPEGATVYGIVSCGGKGVKDVVISDGVLVTKTDKDGIYRLNSTKPHGYVFMSVPSGYEPLCQGILPLIHVQLEKPAATPERADFTLLQASGQDKHTMLVLGDIHLAGRYKKSGEPDDVGQFKEFVKDINSYVSSAGKNVYAITLGDMTWDFYWQIKPYYYGYKEYLVDANGIKNLTIYHTIGNHDHSMYEFGDFNTVREYKKVIAPTYYSFNIGKVHYVVLDNVECTNKDVAVDDDGNPCYVRDYNKKGIVVQEQYDWLRNDLSYVDENTPIVVTMHIPMHNESGSVRMDGYSTLADILDDYPQAQVFTGHTHKMYNVDKTASRHIFEHNAGSVCGTWWWTAKETPGIHIGQDGSPGGYTVMKVNGTDFSWQYKATGRALDYQFRTYDRNSIAITKNAYIPNADAEHKDLFKPGIWENVDSSNEVYINIWNWDDSWTLEVKEEGGRILTWSRETVLDPLHLVSYTTKRINANKKVSFPTENNSHMFRVTASSADVDLSIKVTDRFGNVYTETMSRPRAFNENTYSTNQ